MFKESDSWIVFIFGKMAFWVGLIEIAIIILAIEIAILLLAKECKSWLIKIPIASIGTLIIIGFIYRFLENHDNLSITMCWSVGNMSYILLGLLTLITIVTSFDKK